MVNWHDPALILRDYLVLLKLLYALAGLYIWETVFTAGFELNVLRGKQPYRWTIWIYLGTRYTCLFVFILFFIHNNNHVPCQPFIISCFALSYASWAFASLIILLRIIAIWNRNIIVSSIAVSIWLVGIALNIRTVTMIVVTYNPLIEACMVLKTHRGLVSSVAILAIDTVLLVIMLLGLRPYAYRRSTGIWQLLYQQCIIWMILAAIAEIPPVVFLILDLNDAWNEMFPPVGITILSICAGRMYRSLSKQGSLTEYSSDSPLFSAGLPVSNCRCGEVDVVHNTVHVTTSYIVTQSDRTMADHVFIPADETRLEFVSPNTTIVAPAETKLNDMPC